MNVLSIILGILLIAAVVVIGYQKGRNDVLKDFLNLCISRIKDLEKENSSLEKQVDKLSSKIIPGDKNGEEFQGHH